MRLSHVVRPSLFVAIASSLLLCSAVAAAQDEAEVHDAAALSARPAAEEAAAPSKDVAEPESVSPSADGAPHDASEATSDGAAPDKTANSADASANAADVSDDRTTDGADADWVGETNQREAHTEHEAPEDDANEAEEDAKTQTGPSVALDAGGFHVESANGQFGFGIKSFAQIWYRAVNSGAPDSADSGFQLGMLRPVLHGHYAKILDYQFMLNINASSVRILNAFVTLHLHPRADLRIGLQKPVFGIELRQGQPWLMFLSRSYASNLSAARDIGVTLDTRPTDRLRLEIGAYNGTDDGAVFSGLGDDSIAGNAGFRWNPVGGTDATPEQPGYLLVGASFLVRRVHGSGANTHLAARNSVAGHTFVGYDPDVFLDGRKFAATAFAFGGIGGLYAQAEFVTSSEQVTQNTGGKSAYGWIAEHAWEASVAYAIGGLGGWHGVRPNKSVFEGGLGALELKARVHGLRAWARRGDWLQVGGSSASRAAALGVSAGVSWILSHEIRVQADYSWTTFDVDGARLAGLNENIVRVGITAGF